VACSPADAPRKSKGKEGNVEGVSKARVGARTKHVIRPDDAEWVVEEEASGVVVLDLDRKGRGKRPFWRFELLRRAPGYRIGC
jgi:hypothetical protein